MATASPRTRHDGAATAIGWKLDHGHREALLARIPPAYPQVMADHVTLKMNVDRREPLPEPCSGRVVGQADDGAGVQCLVVEVEGSADRPDGGIYHITWSLDPAQRRQPIESNGVIAWLGWSPVEPMDVRLIPARF